MSRSRCLAWGALAVLVAVCPTAAAAQSMPPSRPSTLPAPAGRQGWDVSLFQLDRLGTLIGNPITFPCTPTGCERIIKLDVAGKEFSFLIALTFIPRGGYFALQSLDQDINKVVEFERGFVGPLFLQVRDKNRFNAVLRFNLAGPAMKESDTTTTQLMDNQHSRVFQRRMTPDLILRVALAPPEQE